jgi:IS30 family transposase
MSYRHLSESDRTVIFYLQMDHRSQAEIARILGRHRSSIGRELARNVSAWGQYLPDLAQQRARRRRQERPRPRTGDEALMAHVEQKLRACWSPEQIAGRLKAQPPKHLAGRSISHTTIYRWIWSDRRRAERFRPYLRIAWRKRRKPYGKASKRGQIPGRVSIEARPEVAAGRQRIGDWEADTVVGKGRSGYVTTAVDRASRYLVARKLDRCTALQINAALHAGMRRLPAEKRQTMTTDNGREFAGHRRLGQLLGLQVYFAHPYSAWERGTCENTNGLLRQYLPKKTDFSLLTDWQLASYVWQLNSRPRKCLNYRTPAEVFHERPVALDM